MRLLPFFPSSSQLTEVLEFKTDVVTSMPGNEQRFRSRGAPRSVVELTIQSEDSEYGMLNNFLVNNAQGDVLAPSWWEARKPSANLSAGTRTIPCETTNWGDFKVGGYGALVSGPSTFEIFQISAVSSVDLRTPSTLPGLQKAWVARDTWVVPVRLAYLGATQGQTLYPVGMAETRLKYTAVDGSDLRGAAPLTFPTYLGSTLFDRPNQANDNGQAGWSSVVETLDGPSSMMQVSTRSKSVPTARLRVVCRSQREIWEVRSLLHALGGMHKCFWIGTGKRDFFVTQGIGLLQAYFNAAHQNFVATYGANPVAPRGHVQIVSTSGVKSQHQINLALVIDSATEAFGITPANPVDLSDVSRLSRVEFLSLCRLQSDSVRVTHTAMGRAVFEMDLVGVPA